MIDCLHTHTPTHSPQNTHIHICIYYAVCGRKKAWNYSQLYNGTFTLKQTSVELFKRLTERPNGANETATHFQFAGIIKIIR